MQGWYLLVRVGREEAGSQTQAAVARHGMQARTVGDGSRETVRRTILPDRLS
jgi:hypothetical protein